MKRIYLTFVFAGAVCFQVAAQNVDEDRILSADSLITMDGRLDSLYRTCKVFYNIADYKKVQNPDVRELLRYMYKSREANSGLTKQISRSLEYARQNETWRKEFMIMEMQRLVWMKEAQQEGMEKGMQQGIKKGMEQGLEQGREQGLEQGAIEGAHAKAVETARNLIAMGILSPEQTAKATGLSLAQVQQLQQ